MGSWCCHPVPSWLEKKHWRWRWFTDDHAPALLNPAVGFKEAREEEERGTRQPRRRSRTEGKVRVACGEDDSDAGSQIRQLKALGLQLRNVEYDERVAAHL